MAKDLRFLGILRESSRALLKNLALVLPIVIFLLTPLKLLCFIPHLCPTLTIDLNSSASFLAPMLGFRRANKFELQLRPLNLVYSSLEVSLTKYISVLACTGSHFGLRELTSKIRRTWKWLAVTLFYTNLITKAFGFLLSIFALMVNSMTPENNSSEPLAILFGGLLFVIAVGGLLLYLVIVTKVSLVVCVVEEGCYGMDALARAHGLMKWRKLLLCSLMVVDVVINQVFVYFAPSEVGRWRSMAAGKMAKLLASWTLVVLLEVFKSIVLGVYYLECKRSHGRRSRTGGARDIFNNVHHSSGDGGGVN